MKRSPLKAKPPKSEWKIVFAGFRSKQAKKAERFARQFHSREFVEWMQAKPCCTCVSGLGMDSSHFIFNLDGEERRHGIYVDEADNYGIVYGVGESDVSHLAKSRGAGGTWKDAAPQCEACHLEFHQKGRLSFCRARGWPPERLSELAAGYAREWEARLESGMEQEAGEGSR